MSANAGVPQVDAAAHRFDVLVVGGGAVGGCVAALLRGAPGTPGALCVGLLAPQPIRPPLPAQIDARVVALSRASQRILGVAGAWSRMPPERRCACERMRVWHESTAARARGGVSFDAAEAGEPDLGSIVEIATIETALEAELEARGVVRIAAPLGDMSLGEDGARVVTPAGVLEAQLLIGADGARSAVRSAVGISADVTSLRQTAIVARVLPERPHEHTAWQRFMRQGTLALLPLADGAVAIVWSADEVLAERLLALDAGEFARELEAASDGVLGALHPEGERQSFPLQRLEAQRYSVHRVALVGDAAHVVHPLAGQGMNLGLLDAAALAEVLLDAVSGGEDPGATRVLRAWERARRSEVQLMAQAIGLFDRLLAHGTGPLSWLARRGLRVVDQSPMAKRAFIARALGLTGELPRMVRRAR